jgi:putative flavoprotein involved in K+ transport
MTKPIEEIVVVGAGAAGLCAAWYARKRGWQPIVLDNRSECGGAWLSMNPSMRCISPVGRDRMPDTSIPQGDGGHASGQGVVAWIQDFQRREAFEIQFGVQVESVERVAEGFRLTTSAGVILTRRLIAATGEFGHPFVPVLPGVTPDEETHVATFEPSGVCEGERVVIVGAGNSGVELAVQLDDLGVDVTVSARTPIKRPRPLPTFLSPIGWWLSGIPLRAQPKRGGCTDRVPVETKELWGRVVEQRIRMVGETVERMAMGIRTREGEIIEAEHVVFATGYIRDNGWLGGVIQRRGGGLPFHRDGLSMDVPGLGFVGIPCMRTWRSGFLRGFAQDAAAVVGGLT